MFLFKQVHLAQPKKARGRPHQSNSNKSPRGDMVILKRKVQKKIVHNRGFEYPAARMSKHYHSNIVSFYYYVLISFMQMLC